MIEPALNPESGFRRLRIDIAYDGTNYAGWASLTKRRYKGQSKKFWQS
jgi:tRNA pseudouridine38-40 synthase